jgi:hypothetical protein
MDRTCRLWRSFAWSTSRPASLRFERECSSQNRSTGHRLRSSLAHGPQLPLYPETGICSVAASLMNNRMVAAHRVVRQSLNIQALDTLTDNADSLAPFLNTLDYETGPARLNIDKSRLRSVLHRITRGLLYYHTRSILPPRRCHSMSLLLAAGRPDRSRRRSDQTT